MALIMVDRQLTSGPDHGGHMTSGPDHGGHTSGPNHGGHMTSVLALSTTITNRSKTKAVTHVLPD